MTKIVYSVYNDTPFEIIKIRTLTINKDIFGLRKQNKIITAKNLKTNKLIDVDEERFNELTYTKNIISNKSEKRILGKRNI